MRQMLHRRLALIGALPLLSCTAPGGPGSEPFVPAILRDGSPEEVSTNASAVCLPAAAESLPGRSVAAS